MGVAATQTTLDILKCHIKTFYSIGEVSNDNRPDDIYIFDIAIKAIKEDITRVFAGLKFLPDHMVDEALHLISEEITKLSTP